MGIGLSKEATDPSLCPICLGPVVNKALIDDCQHEFCFECISLMSQSGHRRCPYCRQVFHRVKINIKSPTCFDWHWTNRRAEMKHLGRLLCRQSDDLFVQFAELERRLEEIRRERMDNWSVFTWLWMEWRIAQIGFALAAIRDNYRKLMDDLEAWKQRWDSEFANRQRE